MNCSTCTHCIQKIAYLGVRWYCRRYKRNVNQIDHCIDWRAKA